MDDKQREIRERYGKQHLPRLFNRTTGDQGSEIRKRHVGIGIALGTGFGLAVGAGLGVAFGNVGRGIGLGLCIGTALGVAVGSGLGDKHAKPTSSKTSMNE